MTASLQEKNGKFHVVLSWRQGDQWKNKWVSTGLPVKGNKKRAEEMRIQILEEWSEKMCDNYDDMLFSKYLLKWLDERDKPLADITYNDYKRMIKNIIGPYFDERKIRLQTLRAHHLKDFYNHRRQNFGVSGNRIGHYHALIHAALKHGVKYEIIKENVAEKVYVDSSSDFKADFYSKSEIAQLVAAIQGTKIEMPVYLTCWFGFRRGEICGLRWSDIDFINKTLSINGTMADIPVADGGRKIYWKPNAKTKSSLRTYPLTDQMVKYLKRKKIMQLENRLKYGEDYSRDWMEYVCVDDHGNLLTPGYVSWKFPKLLEEKGLRRIRFHDLRHTCASLLLGKGANMYDIKDWLGHDQITTTIDLYGHLELEAKKSISRTLEETPELACLNG